MVKSLCQKVEALLATPRAPSAAEAVSYGSYAVPGTDLVNYATLYDWGGVTQTQFDVGAWNQTALTEVVEKYFWRTGGLADEISNQMEAWGDERNNLFFSPFQQYFTTRTGFFVMWPYFAMHELDLPQPGTQQWYYPADNEHNPSRGYAWSMPYIDLVTRKWVITVMLPLYEGEDSVLELGVCAMDMYVGSAVTYVEELSATLEWGTYIVLAATDGTLMAIPQRGNRDWSGDIAFNYTALTTTADYNLSNWNLFTSPEFASIARPILESLHNESGSGTATVHFSHTGHRLIAWETIPQEHWLVLAVVDEGAAFADERRARIVIIVVSSVLAVLVVVLAVSAAVVGLVQRHSAGLSNRIADLDEQLHEAQEKNELLKKGLVEGDDAATVAALSSGIQGVAKTILNLVANPTKPISAKDSEHLKQAVHMLLHKDQQVVKTKAKLNEFQRQLIFDCGMDVQEGCNSTTRRRQSDVSSRSVLCSDIRDHEWSTWNIDPVTAVDVNGWNFNVFQTYDGIGGKGLLRAVVMPILVEQGVLPATRGQPGPLPLELPRLFNFLDQLEDGYCGDATGASAGPTANPYHNVLHAADVTQAFHFFLTLVCEASPGVREAITPQDRLACVLACAAHDYTHPGRNNVFLRATLAKVHVQYFDSVLERLHLSRALRLLLLSPKCQALRNLTQQQQIQIHALIAKLILATDMAKHVEFIDTFKAWATSVHKRGGEDPASLLVAEENGKVLLLQMLLKAADICNTFRPWDTCTTWCARLVEEFSRQGEEERALGLETSKFMDGRATPQEMQVCC
eukprot:TRINITY_DN476_c0_g1_i3.p1 TRINITY_DN476_c0_g1~~TRINITY_DN476_c0_g1_i3.p1  ORF type:complete len:806 (-),score=210.46 TRINITY_DN476_c0_g1_i3:1238-3631(-)